MSIHVIENIDNVKITQNELYTYHTLNRNIIKLLDNDMRLRELYDKVFSNFKIKEYNPGAVYQAGELVWLKKNGDLYLLKNIFPGNTINLLSEEILPKEFMKFGWKNCNEYLNIMSLGLSAALSVLVNQQMEDHVNEQHPYGPLTLDEYSDNYVGKKFLNKNLSNIDHSRQTTFFPRAVYKFDDGGTVIMNGSCRIYDTPINSKYSMVEYDIHFKLGSDGNDLDNIFAVRQQLSANTISIKPYTGVSMATVSANKNNDYFTNSAQMDIFNGVKKMPVGESRIGSIYQKNRNDYVNTYSAIISFPYNFIDLNYMVFSNSVLSQGTTDKKLVQSANEIVFCNKQRDSITVLDITFPPTQTFGNGINAENSGLVQNCFSCKIIGIAQV